MPNIRENPSITTTCYRDYSPGVNSEAPITLRRGEVARRAWQHLIDQTLSKWLHDPSILDDEGIQPPTGTIIRLSMDLAELYRDQGLPAPDIVVVDPNGGIVFERREGSVTELLHVWEDGAVEYMRLDGTRLSERTPVLFGT
jgi:hypothetical protein